MLVIDMQRGCHALGVYQRAKAARRALADAALRRRPAFLVLTINQHFKTVPYLGATNEGSVNYGFQNVRGTLRRRRKIAKVQDDEALRDAIVRINAPATAFFTIGCAKFLDQDGAEYWGRGFIEFAFNSCPLVQDAQNYFPVFFHFNNRLLKDGFSYRVHFEWQLEKNPFKTGNCEGFSVVLWITTETFATDEASRAAWKDAVKIVTDHLSGGPAPEAAPIYRKRSPRASVSSSLSALSAIRLERVRWVRIYNLTE